MMGVPLTRPSFIYGDNNSQVTNSSRPESTLKKKCNSICYHAIRESAAMGESLITHIRTQLNLADFLTKVTNGATRRRLVGNVCFDIYDNKTKHVRFDIHNDKTNRRPPVSRLILRELRKYDRAEGVTLPPSEEIFPSRGSNSPAVGAQNLTQFGEKGAQLDSIWRERERIAGRFYPPVHRTIQ
jgi:hypothetical protein